MKMVQIVAVRKTIDELRQTKFCPQTAYKLMKLSKSVDAEKTFYEEKIKEIVDEYGKKDANGNFIKSDAGIKIDEARIDDCNKAVSELNDVEVQKPDITFTIEELSPALLSLDDMMVISEFIVES